MIVTQLTWIPASDPPYVDQCIGTMSPPLLLCWDGRVAIGRRMFLHSNAVWIIEDRMVEDVTHWAALPDPPR